MLSYRAQGFSGSAVQYSPFFDNKLALASAANFGLVGNGRLHIVEVTPDGNVVPSALFDTQDGLFDVAWSELHENHVVVASGDGSIRLFDITASRPFPIAVFQEHTKEVFSVSWNLVDKALFCSASWDGSIKVWNPTASAAVATFVAPSTRPAAAAAGVGVPHAAHAAQNPGGGAAAASPDCIYSAKFSPHEATTLASAHNDSTVRLWDTRSRSPAAVQVVPNAHMGTECLALDWNKYRPSVLATAGVDKAVKVWDLRNLRSPLNDLRGHDLGVRAVSWSPFEADKLLSASYDTSVRVWTDQSESSQSHIPRMSHNKGLLSVFDKHTEFATGVDWSLWGQPGWVASTGFDGMLYIWKAC
ncbi:peroxisomal targeting signal 2 receptor [Trichomonascus vanleenenianus]|uniref:Pex7p n=1 Tax=Trichomonascus vanleenenianus TaxID=2268995 RepID=UPI003ECBA591